MFQNKDDPDKWAELKRLQVEYERKRSAMFNFYESVKNAQQVQVHMNPLYFTEIIGLFIGLSIYFSYSLLTSRESI